MSSVGIRTTMPAMRRPRVMIMVMIFATMFAALAHYIPGRILRGIMSISTAASAVTFAMTVRYRIFERYSRIRVRKTEGKEYCRKNNEFLHICLSLTRDVVSPFHR